MLRSLNYHLKSNKNKTINTNKSINTNKTIKKGNRLFIKTSKSPFTSSKKTLLFRR